MHIRRKLVATGVAAALSTLSGAAIATNGMNLEGYGPIATAMGGASMAYDNGVAAVMNNPATLSLMPEGSDRVDLSLGFLGPDVEANMSMGTAKYRWPSGGDSYYMPNIGWVTSVGRFTFGFGGLGMFAQGGMGTEFPNGGPGSLAVDGAISGMINDTTPEMPSMPELSTMQNFEERSELGVARIVIPLSARVNDRLSVGGSIDWVRANLDIKMAMTGQQFMGLNPQMSAGLQSMFTPMFEIMQTNAVSGTNSGVSNVHAAQMDFSDDSDYSGQAVGSGFAGKIGFTYKINQDLNIGATYHSKTALSDLEGSASMAMAVDYYDSDNNVTMQMPMTMTGKVSVVDFEWPSMLGIGVAYQASDKLFIAADIKRVNWSDVMDSFNIKFTADANANFGLPAGQTVMVSMPQNWDNQTVFQLGGAYQMNDQLVLRAGFNYGSNPIPDAYLHYLFPAIVERHFTVGFGYDVTDVDQVNFAFSHAPEVSATNSSTGVDMVISHSQSNWQLMYSRMF